MIEFQFIHVIKLVVKQKSRSLLRFYIQRGYFGSVYVAVCVFQLYRNILSFSPIVNYIKGSVKSYTDLRFSEGINRKALSMRCLLFRQAHEKVIK